MSGVKIFVKSFLLLLSFTCATGFAPGIEDHDIHLSLCELRFNEPSSSFEVAIKIFIDDLEKAVQKNGVKDFRIVEGVDVELTDEHIASYLDQVFLISIDGNKLKSNFLGKETSDDMIAVWCYLEFPKNKIASNKCTLSNRILLDIYDDQKNIMDIRMSQSHKDYTILDMEKDSWNYSFSNK